MANGTSDPESIKRAAFGALQILKDNLPEGCKLSIDKEDNVVITALKRHGTHLDTHTVSQHHLDPYKLVCWLGCAIIDGIEDVTFYQQRVVVDAIIKTLEEFLAYETSCQVRVTPNDRELLKRLMMAELTGKPEHGIGFNGLFMAFHCYRSSFHQVNKTEMN
jgi:hypothetical protein